MSCVAWADRPQPRQRLCELTDRRESSHIVSNSTELVRWWEPATDGRLRGPYHGTERHATSRAYGFLGRIGLWPLRQPHPRTRSRALGAPVRIPRVAYRATWWTNGPARVAEFFNIGGQRKEIPPNQSLRLPPEDEASDLISGTRGFVHSPICSPRQQTVAFASAPQSNPRGGSVNASPGICNAIRLAKGPRLFNPLVQSPHSIMSRLTQSGFRSKTTITPAFCQFAAESSEFPRAASSGRSKELAECRRSDATSPLCAIIETQ